MILLITAPGRNRKSAPPIPSRGRLRPSFRAWYKRLPAANGSITRLERSRPGAPSRAAASTFWPCAERRSKPRGRFQGPPEVQLSPWTPRRLKQRAEPQAGAADGPYTDRYTGPGAVLLARARLPARQGSDRPAIEGGTGQDLAQRHMVEAAARLGAPELPLLRCARGCPVP